MAPACRGVIISKKAWKIEESPRTRDVHYCRMVQTRHYDQRPFDETMCDAIITNNGVKNPSKKVHNVCDGGCIKHGSYFSCVCDAGHTVQPINCLRWGGTKEMGSQMKVCAIYNIRFTRMNCVWLGNSMEMVQLNKKCVIHGKQVRNQKSVRRPIITQTIAANNPCELLCLQ